MTEINHHQCPACETWYSTFDAAMMCCLRHDMEPIKPVLSEKDTRCKGCGRFIPKGFNCRCNTPYRRRAEYFTNYYRAHRDWKLNGANERYRQQKQVC